MSKITLLVLSIAFALGAMAPAFAFTLNASNTPKTLFVKPPAPAKASVPPKAISKTVPKTAAKEKISVVKKQNPRIEAFKIYQQATIKARADYNATLKVALSNYKSALKKAVTKKQKSEVQTDYKNAQQNALRAYKDALKAATEAREKATTTSKNLRQKKQIKQ